MKISFDFDRTLERYRIKNLAINLYWSGNEIWIHTNRPNKNILDENINYDIEQVAKDCLIPDCRIVYCEEEKWKYLQDFDIHFNDNQKEVNEINYYTNCKAILI